MAMGPTNLPGLNTFMALAQQQKGGGGGAMDGIDVSVPSLDNQGGGAGGGLDLVSAFGAGRKAYDGDSGLGSASGDSGDSAGNMGGLGSISPILAKMTKHQMDTMDDEPLSSEDKGLALAKAGFGIAAGQSRHPLVNIGAGALGGVQALDEMKRTRALERMRQAQMAQTQAYQQGQLQNTANLRTIEAQRAATQQSHDNAMEKLAQDRINEMSDREDWKPGGVTADNKVVIINSKTGESRTIDAAPKSAAATIPDAWNNMSPEELRKAVPAGEMKTIDAIIEGRVLPPSAANRSPAAQRMLQLVNMVDPTFDATSTTNRFDTARYFNAKGQGGQAINSANTLVGHLGNLDKHIDDLNNTDVWTGGNSIKNYIDTHTGKMDSKTTEALGKYNADVDVATRELQRLLTRTGGTGEEAMEMRNRLNAAKTPTELHAVVKEYVELMDSRLSALADQKTKGMGKEADVWKDFYSEPARKALAKISPEYAARYTAPAGGTSESPAGGTPAPTKAAPSGKVRVSNGKETLLIDPADAPHAKADGYEVVP